MKRRNQKTYLFILLILALFGLCMVSVLVDEPVEFPDEMLELAIRELLNYHGKPIYRSQLLNIADIDLSEKNISRLEGIENFRNLEILYLRNNNISDVSPLGSLSNLRILDLGYNPIVDLEAANFEDLTKLNLIELNLDHLVKYDRVKGTSRLSDLRLLSEFSSLRSLSLEDNHISDITPLGKLRRLEELNLKDNHLGSLAGLESLSTLERVNLRGNQLFDISSIQNLNHLRYLNLHSNENLTELSPLSELVNLETLIMRDVPVGDQLSVIGKMTKLKRLNIRNCSVSDFSTLFELMAAGALQDQSGKNVFAYLDILENEIPDDPFHLRGFRPFWENIDVKYPMELNDSILPPPEFSVVGGFYNEDIYLELRTNILNASIYYTLDGSIPSLNSRIYERPIHIEKDKIDQDGLMVARVVRARLLLHEGFDASPVVTQTYFVSQNSHEAFALPVVSLVTDPAYFFDSDLGIYHNNNFRQRGKKWERPISISFYDLANDNFSYQEALVRIHGSATRGLFQKSLRFYADNTYEDDDVLKFDFFPGYLAKGTSLLMDEFTTILFRNSGNDYSTTFFKDALIQGLISHTGQDIQAYRPVNVFLNGQYWGIYNIRERLDENYVSKHYGISPDEVLMYEIDAREDFYGQPIEDNEYLQLIELVKRNDINDEEFFRYLETQIDFENYIDNQIIYIYAANGDWLTNNVKFWKKNIDEFNPDSAFGHDGRWRWMVIDMDMAFSNVEQDFIEAVTSSYVGAVLSHALLQNPNFREQFVVRFSDHLNTSFLPSRVINAIDKYESNLEPDMGYHIARWKTMQDSMDQWHVNVNRLRQFAVARPEFIREHIIEAFELSGTFNITLRTNEDFGYIRINTIEILKDTPGVENPSEWSGVYFKELPLTLTAIPWPGYRFSHWEGANEGMNLADSIILYPDHDVQLLAVFEKDLDN
jgi:Leucine-rich repeat (LRR) protein